MGEAMVRYRLNTTGAVATRIGASEADRDLKQLSVPRG